MMWMMIAVVMRRMMGKVTPMMMMILVIGDGDVGEDYDHEVSPPPQQSPPSSPYVRTHATQAAGFA